MPRIEAPHDVLEPGTLVFVRCKHSDADAKWPFFYLDVKGVKVKVWSAVYVVGGTWFDNAGVPRVVLNAHQQSKISLPVRTPTLWGAHMEGEVLPIANIWETE